MGLAELRAVGCTPSCWLCMAGMQSTLELPISAFDCRRWQWTTMQASPAPLPAWCSCCQALPARPRPRLHRPHLPQGAHPRPGPRHLRPGPRHRHLGRRRVARRQRPRRGPRPRQAPPAMPPPRPLFAPQSPRHPTTSMQTWPAPAPASSGAHLGAGLPPGGRAPPASASTMPPSDASLPPTWHALFVAAQSHALDGQSLRVLAP